MDVATLHHRTVECWADRVNAVREDQWDLPTPCAGWTVRDLVNHVVGEDLWTAPLMRGRRIEEVGDRFAGDLLGPAPVTAALEAAKEAVSVVAEELPGAGAVHLSYGDEEPAEYLHQLAADHLVHGWDLAAATGQNTHLDPQLVTEVGRWFAEREEMYRAAGVVGPRQALVGDRQADLLAGFGRSADWGVNHALLARFTAAFGRGDVDAACALLAEDCVFEATGPAPDGRRVEGVPAVREVWREMFAATAEPEFVEEESFVCRDRGVVRWRYSWAGAAGERGHVRGVDVLTFRDGRIAEKLSYVKG